MLTKKWRNGLTICFGLAALMGCGSGNGGSNGVGSTNLTISGRVSGATDVRMTLSGTSSGTTTTDGTGSYSFGSLGKGSYTVTPSKEGYTFDPTSIVVELNGNSVDGKVFTATALGAAAYTISGTVSGAIADGVLMTLSGDESRTAHTMGGGRYYFSGLGNGNYTVTPSLSGYRFSPESASVPVSGGDVGGQDFVAKGALSVTGGVMTASGNGLLGATVTLTVTASGAVRGTAVTDSAGDYTITDVPPGSYTLTASKEGYTFQPATQPVEPTDASVTASDFTTQLTWFASDEMPCSVVTGPDGNLWFVKYYANPGKVGRMTPGGELDEFVLDKKTSPLEITVGPDGNLWFTESQANRIGRITLEGAISTFDIGDGGAPATNTRVTGITPGPSDGKLWFTMPGIKSLGRIDPSLPEDRIAGSVKAFNIGEIGYDIVAGSDGALWILGINQVLRVVPNGDTTPTVTPFAVNFADMVAGLDGYVWYTVDLDGVPAPVGRFKPSANPSFDAYLTPSFGSYGIAIDPGGDIWITGMDKIGRIATDGTLTEITVPEAVHLDSIAVAPDGSIWFTDGYFDHLGLGRL